MKYIFLLLFISTVGSLSAQTDWVSLPTTVDDEVYSMVEYDGKLIMGGAFEKADTLTVNGIATWDGENWGSLGNGLGNMDNAPYVYVSNMTVHDDKLYAVGNFSLNEGQIGNNIAVWDGLTWSPVGTGSNTRINDIIGFEEDIFVCGEFDSIGGIEVSRFARWDGTSWYSVDSVSSGLPEGIVVADFYATDEYLYASGAALDVDSQYCGSVMRYDGESWECISSDLDYACRRLGMWNDTLLTGNNITLLNGSPANLIHKLDGSDWEIFSNQINNPDIQEFIVYDSDLYYVGGWNLFSDQTDSAKVRKWNGSVWEHVGTGLSSIVDAAVIYNGEFYIGGGFSQLRNSPHDFVAKLSHNIGLAEHESFNLTISPNPTSNIVSIEMKGFDGSIFISDLSGRLLNQFDIPEQTDSYTLDVSGYISGVYLINLVRKDGLIKSEKIIVQ